MTEKLFADASLVLFDTTSTYFEGAGPEELASFGFSRDKRGDRPQANLALLTSREGLPLGHGLYPRQAEGHTILEIARQTHLNPKSIDAYLKTFDSVLILHLYRVPPGLAATIIGHGASLIDEYHQIMRSYLKDPETMRDHLIARGVKLVAQALQTG